LVNPVDKAPLYYILADNGIKRVPQLVGDGRVEDGEQLVLLLALAVEDTLGHVLQLENGSCGAFEFDI